MVQKCPVFVNVHTIENVNAGGYVVKESHNLVNIVCERPLSLLLALDLLFELDSLFDSGFLLNLGLLLKGLILSGPPPCPGPPPLVGHLLDSCILLACLLALAHWMYRILEGQKTSRF